MNPTVCTDHRRGDFSQQTPKATVTGRFTSAGTDPSVFLSLYFIFLFYYVLIIAGWAWDFILGDI